MCHADRAATCTQAARRPKGREDFSERCCLLSGLTCKLDRRKITCGWISTVSVITLDIRTAHDRTSLFRIHRQMKSSPRPKLPIEEKATLTQTFLRGFGHAPIKTVTVDSCQGNATSAIPEVVRPGAHTPYILPLGLPSLRLQETGSVVKNGEVSAY
jgi:hypothetical protein